MSDQDASIRRNRVTGRFTRWKYVKFEDPSLSDEEQAARYEEYLDNLKMYGEYARSAEAGNWSPKEIARLRKSEPWFQALCDDAIGRHTSVLVGEAHRRAVEGSPRYALGGKERDQPIQVETVYSDHLLTLALRRRDPTFGDKQTIEMKADVNLASQFNYAQYPPSIRKMLRDLLVAIKDLEAERSAENTDQSDESGY